MHYRQHPPTAIGRGKLHHLLPDEVRDPSGRDDAPGSDRHEMTSPAETRSILRKLSEQDALVTFSFIHDYDFDLLTSTVELTEDGSTLILDQGKSPALNRTALLTKTINCESVMENIKILFILNGMDAGNHRGRDVFLSPVPGSLIRLQRRADYRLPTSQIHPILARVPLRGQDGLSMALEAVVVDISGGGMCLSVSPDYPSIERDATLRRVTFTLPHVGMVTADLQVRNVHPVNLPNGKVHQRAVCQFINLPTPMMNLIQRFIFKAQRERIAHGH